MNAIVVYESSYGNTHALPEEAMARRLGGSLVVPVSGSILATAAAQS